MTCPFSLCDGTGWVFIDDLHDRPCRCTQVRTLKTYLGPEISAATSLSSSPLYVVGEGGAVQQDGTCLNLLIRSPWIDLLPHLKWVFVYKGVGFRFRVVTDEKLKTVYVGAESYAARAKGKRDEIATYNSLTDLVGPDINLLIIRLGFLGHKNIAMPGILKETLMLREAAEKPTWLVEDPGYPFGEGHLSYNIDVGDYVDKHFDIVALEATKEKPTEAAITSSLISTDDVSIDDEQVVERPSSKSRYVPTPLDQFDDVFSKQTKKKFKKRGTGPI